MGVLILMPETLAEAGVGESVIGVMIESAIEDCDGTIDVLRLLIVLKIAASAKIEIVCGGLSGAMRGHQCAVLSGEFHVEQIEDAVHDTILKRERIIHLSGD